MDPLKELHYLKRDSMFGLSSQVPSHLGEKINLIWRLTDPTGCAFIKLSGLFNQNGQVGGQIRHRHNVPFS